MRFWSSIELTSAHRPTLLPYETDIMVQSSTGIYEGRLRIPDYQDGRLYLTSHRVCYVDNTEPLTHSVAINLTDVATIQYSAGFMKSSPKITLNMKDSTLSLSSPGTPVSMISNSNSLSSGSSLDVTTQLKSIANNSQSFKLTWTCPICSYSNIIPSGYIHGSSPLPSCTMCGVKPPITVIEEVWLKSVNTSDSSTANDQISDSSHATPIIDKDSKAVSIDEENGVTCNVCTFVNHPLLKSCEMCGSKLGWVFNPADYVMDEDAQKLQDSYFPFIFNKAVSDQKENVPKSVRLSFRSGGDKIFYERLTAIVLEKTWLKNQAKSKNISLSVNSSSLIKSFSDTPTSEVPESLPKFGIHGLQRMNENELKQNTSLLTSLDDLKSLMSKAKEMVSLAETFASKLSSAPGVPKDAREVLRDSSRALSLSSPIVTREMAGGGNDLFYAELARQLAEFLGNGVLQLQGGIVTLFDLFALYNRARGISLISPNELYSACQTFEKLGLPLKLRRFKSGLWVVEEAKLSSADKLHSLISYIKSSERGLTAQDISLKFGWSVGVASEELYVAMELGQLCCDIVTEGTFYYHNKIAHFEWNWKYEVFREGLPPKALSPTRENISLAERLIAISREHA
ncbi:EAP30/Vps36 family-domain-containing protein [Dipodascopsis uninucleata]